MDPYVTSWRRGNGLNPDQFMVGDVVNARFCMKEPEPTPPDGFEVDHVVFGGAHMTVTYRVVRDQIPITDNLFYPDREQEAFDRYRQSLIDFHAYRADLLQRGVAGRQPRKPCNPGCGAPKSSLELKP